jgi:single-strand DNA-binding protein
LNKVQLIGNLTRDPELRYTPTGKAVCSFSIATNRSWTTDGGEKKEEVDFHRVVAWNKLAELCSQLLAKGRKAYVEGRLTNRKYTTQDGQEKQITEIVIDDMLVLDSKRPEGEVSEYHTSPAKSADAPAAAKKTETEIESEPDQSVAEPESNATSAKTGEMSSEEIADDIPF